MTPRKVLYGAFKAMGDLLSAAPVLKAELDRGSEVYLLIFPNLQAFVDLLDLGPRKAALRTIALPVAGLASLPAFFRAMAGIAPTLVWVSPHAPGPASSWKIPLLLWLAKRLYWPSATLAGAQSERLSILFNIRIPVDRRLPFTAREWTAYALVNGPQPVGAPPAVAFQPRLHAPTRETPSFDLLIHPGAGAANRKWPYTHYPELLRNLPSAWRIAVLGLPEDILGMKAALPPDPRVEFLSGSLEFSIANLARARLVLTMDSGNMFFANLLGVPTIAIFGASDPANVLGATATPGSASANTVIHPVYEQRLACQPCGRSRCTQAAPFCITAINPSSVANQIIALHLQHKRPSPHHEQAEQFSNLS